MVYNVQIVCGLNTNVFWRWTMYGSNYLLVDSDVLPEIFRKVIHAKTLLAQGKAKNSSQAAQMAEISRSAFYKYKDSVFMYDRRMSDNIITFYINLEDRAGILSQVLAVLHEVGASVLTINQSIPVDMVAPVTISVRMNDVEISDDELFEKLKEKSGVVSLRRVSSH